jgi:hypothetical protein
VDGLGFRQCDYTTKVKEKPWFGAMQLLSTEDIYRRVGNEKKHGMIYQDSWTDQINW